MMSAFRMSWKLAAGLLATATAGFTMPPPQQTPLATLNTMAWDDSHRGQDLDLTGYHLTFDDEFKKMSVTDDKGAGPWFAPVHTDYGAATFLRPTRAGPFTVADGALHIRAALGDDGKWSTGSMQTMDSRGCGFAQKFGYFEMKAKLPESPATWIGFWLKSANEYRDPASTDTRSEIDVLEEYGSDPKGYHTAVHLRPRGAPGAIVKNWHRSHYIQVTPPGAGVHLYGAKLTPDWTIFYMDRKELSRWRTLPEQQQSMFMLVTFAMQPEDLAKATSPLDMTVDYVQAYASDSSEPDLTASANPPRSCPRPRTGL